MLKTEHYRALRHLNTALKNYPDLSIENLTRTVALLLDVELVGGYGSSKMITPLYSAKGCTVKARMDMRRIWSWMPPDTLFSSGSWKKSRRW